MNAVYLCALESRSFDLMAAGTMATAAGAAVILYYMFGRRAASKDGSEEEDDDSRSGDFSKSRSLRRRLSRRPAQAPATWIESMSTLSDTLRFTYSETLGKWPIGDLAFGINYLMRRQVSNLASNFGAFWNLR